jgi:manganese/zinc/iron transport system permease protein
MYQRYRSQVQHREKINNENVLKLLYHLNESGAGDAFTPSELSSKRYFDTPLLESTLDKLCQNGLLSFSEGKYTLTADGRQAAMRVVRLHRLWELYLNVRMNIAQDHVHNDAEAIEHIITPELEEALLKELNYPSLDPHASVIPGVNTTGV